MSATPKPATPPLSPIEIKKLKRTQARRIRGMSMPGEGSTTNISIVTVVALAFLWWLATQPRLGARRCSCRRRQAVWKAFFAAIPTGELQGGKPLLEHFGWQLVRVFAAFFLACITAMPVGIAMGMSRIARGIFDPPLEFYRPLPPLAYLPLIIIWFGIDELPQGAADLPGVLRAARARGARRHAQRVAGADQRRLFDGRELRGRWCAT